MGQRRRPAWVLAVLLGAALVLPAAPAAPTPAAAAASAQVTTGLAIGDVSDLPAGVRAGDDVLARDALREGLSGQRFYFVLPDRFANGDQSNDRGGRNDDDRMLTGFDPTDARFYHGGDLAGLRSKLDYLRGMGMTAVWITPPFRNKWVQVVGGQVYASYHGYSITDFTSLDPHFGTMDDMRDFISCAHSKGIKVFFDIVANHTADVIDSTDGHDYRTVGAYPYLDADGKPFDIAAYAGRPDFPKLDIRRSFPRQPVFHSEADAHLKKPNWLNDPTLYHNRGSASSVTGEQAIYGDTYGLDGLMTEHPRVVEGMKEIFTSWIDTLDIDGYRVDTVKHSNIEFWRDLVPYVKSYAAGRGKPDFFIFGEVFDSDPAVTSTYTTRGRMPAVLDFPFQAGAREFIAGRGAEHLGQVLRDDAQYIDADHNAYSLPTFLDNHDMGRLGWMLRQDRPGLGKGELLERLRLAHTLLYFWRGNPVVYYGDEQGFIGGGTDEGGREDMFPTRVAQYAAEDQVGTDRTPAEDNFHPDHPLYQHLAHLASFVGGDSVWRRGNQVLRLADHDVLAFSRIDPANQVEYVVVANAGNDPATAEVPVAARGMDYCQMWPAEGDSRGSGADGRVRVSLPARSAVVLRSAGRLPTGDSAPTPTFVAPPRGSSLATRVELRVDGVTSPFGQATFAARVRGAAQWTVLGTNDAAPYRVFADLASLPGAANDTRVELRAVVKDAAGRLGAHGAIVSLVRAPAESSLARGVDWLVVHYARPASDYDGWGLHVWGDVVEQTSWWHPLPFAGRSGDGRFAWVRLKPGARRVGIVVHHGDDKDVAIDRFVDPSVTPQVWLNEGQHDVRPSEASATSRIMVHYQRPAGDYGGWHLRVSGGVAAAEAELTTRDDFGAVAEVRLDGSGKPVEFAVTKDGVADVSGSITPATSGRVWLREGDSTVYSSRTAAEQRVVLHYHRPAGDYDGWTLYHWDGSARPSPAWDQSQRPDGRDEFGVYWSVPLASGASGLSYLIHAGDAKDPGADQRIDVATVGNEVWYQAGSAHANGSASYVLPPLGLPAPDADLAKAKAVWVSRDRVVWDVPMTTGDGYQLRYDADGRITVRDGVVDGGRVLRLEPDRGGLPPELAAKFPYLRGKPVYRMRPADVAYVGEALRGQVVAVHVDSGGVLRQATGVQIAGVLDDLYASTATRLSYGPVFDGDRPMLRLWAPTATAVRVRLFGRQPPSVAAPPHEVVDLSRDNASGSWSVTGPPSWRDQYYTYEVTGWQPAVRRVRTVVVTDPYSLALAVDSTHSQLVDLTDPSTAPPGWDADVVAACEDTPTAHAVIDLHLRDFSAHDDTVPEADRGTYRAFTHLDSAGMRHLRELAEAGMDTVNLMPTFDFTTVPERRTDQRQPPCDLASYPADSEVQQECVGKTAGEDGYNWGYDPWHFNVPEGSYATDDAQSGAARTRQYRQMVKALHDNGNRLVLDVVYNHTATAGDDPKSVLDRVVPGYYHRLLADGAVANSTCCANTAPENAMMGKLVVDSVVGWARLYKVDGFRIDLMGHHPKANILAVRAALDALTPQRDGVDGSRIRLYGEGWDFGEVAGGARFEQATQATLAGTGIGTFNDRLRDAIRGGGAFDSDPRGQGLGSGLAGDLNGAPVNGSTEQQNMRLASYTDIVKLGMAGNGADFRFRSSAGAEVIGRDVRYNGAAVGYTVTPAEAITYVDTHDGETLYDTLTYKLPESMSMADRVRMQVLSLAPALLGQGQPFVLAGTEFLRSKSFDRDSYNSGDWFNCYDPGLRDNGFGRGLPPAPHNKDKWFYAKPLLANPAVRPSTSDMRAALDRTLDLLRIRQSSPLFTLGDATLVQQKLSFPYPGPQAGAGVVVAYLDDTVGPRVDPDRGGILVVINPTPQPQTVTLPPGSRWRLHEVQVSGSDPVVRTTEIRPDIAIVPPRTSAVLVR